MSNTSIMWPFFQALPAYVGGKRRLCPLIFTAIARVISKNIWRSLRFLDPFLGGGSVSLFAKAQGFEVFCNDLALRSALVGRALIENSTVQLTRGDVLQLLLPPASSYPRTAQQRFSPAVFALPHARLLDRTLHQARTCFDQPKQDLALLLLLKWALRLQPMSQVRGTDARAAATGDFDTVSPRRLGHYLGSYRLLPPQAFFSLAHEVNAGVFPGRGRAFELDAFDFLAQAKGDVVYLDPPYAGTTSYEKEYAVLDELLEGRGRRASPFSSRTPPLHDLLAACRHIPTLILSAHSGFHPLDELVDLVKRHRPVVLALEVPYRHLGSIASARRNADNREFIVVAVKEGTPR